MDVPGFARGHGSGVDSPLKDAWRRPMHASVLAAPSRVLDRERLAALEATGLLDSAPEAAFDRVTRIAAGLLGTPLALVSLVDADRHYFKSAFGGEDPLIGGAEAPLSHAFCVHVVERDAPLAVEDARVDPLVADNVSTLEHGVRAYLGVPLRHAGHPLGAVCVVTREPRTWTAAETAALHELAEISSTEIALRAALVGLREEQTQRLTALRTLAGTLAHDFNNLLYVIRTSAVLLQEDLDPGSESRRDAEEIAGAAQRGSELTRELLLFSGRAPAAAPETELTGGIDQVVGMLRRSIGDILLTVIHDAGPLHARFEPSHLERATINLVVNARDALAGPGTVQIATTRLELDAPAADGLGVAPGAYARIAVRDDGPGMDAATRRRAIEPYFTTKPEGKGTGLGLAGTHGTVTAAGGALAIDSAPGEGTTVALYLPLAAA